MYLILGQATKISTLFQTNYLPGNSSSYHRSIIYNKINGTLMSKLKSSDIYKPCTCMRILFFSLDTLLNPSLFLLYIFFMQRKFYPTQTRLLENLVLHSCTYLCITYVHACMIVLLPPPPLQMKLNVGGISAECIIFSVPRRKKAVCHHS